MWSCSWTDPLSLPPTGAVLVRSSAKAIVVAGSLASAFGSASFAYVDRPWQAFACSIASGAGLGAAGTANRGLIIAWVEHEQRGVPLRRAPVAGNLGLGSGAAAVGLIAAAHERPSTFHMF